MSKITVRADDDLVAQLEAMEASKSQVVREALRAYLDGDDAAGDVGDVLTDGDVIEDADGGAVTREERQLDDLVGERVDELVTERVDEVLGERVDELASNAGTPARRDESTRDVNVNVTVEGAPADGERDAATGEAPSATESRDAEGAVRSGDAVSSDDGVRSDPQSEESDSATCAQCGDQVDGDHVYCPNCGEKATRRVFCDCGDELRSDWAFCPSCGRRTPAADVLETE